MTDKWIIRKTADLQEPPKLGKIAPEYALMYPGDNLAHVLKVTVLDNKEPAVWLDGTVTAYFQRKDGSTVLLTGSILDGIATVTLDQTCYAISGFSRCIVRLTNATTEAVVTLAEFTFTVQPAIDNGEIIDPGEAIPGIDDLLAQIEAMEEATAAAEAASTKLAPTFSASKAYAVGDYVINAGTIYRFNKPHSAGSWSGTDAVSVASLAGEITNNTNELELYTGIREIDISALEPTEDYPAQEYTKGYYITTSGATIDISAKTQGSAWRCAVIGCKEGDLFTISGSAGTSPRLWAFISTTSTATPNRLSVAPNGTVGENMVIYAPKDAQYLVVNFSSSRPYALRRGVYTGRLQYVTPEMFGAVGDGSTDDTDAITAFMNNKCDLKIFTSSKTYKVTNVICPDFPGGTVIGYGATIECSITSITDSNYNKCVFQDYTTRSDTVLSRTTNRRLNLYGLTIKGNASNYSTFSRPMSANGCFLWCMVGFKSVAVRDCNFSDSGMVAFSVDNVEETALFDNCRVEYAGRYISSGDGKTEEHMFRWEGIAVVNHTDLGVQHGDSFIVQNCYFNRVMNSPAAAAHFRNVVIRGCTIDNSHRQIFERHPKDEDTETNITMEDLVINKMMYRLLTVATSGSGQRVRATLRNIRITDFAYDYGADTYPVEYTSTGGLIWIGKEDGDTAPDAVLDIDGLDVTDYVPPVGSEDTLGHGITTSGVLNISNSRFSIATCSISSAFFNAAEKLVMRNVVANGYIGSVTFARKVDIEGCEIATTMAPLSSGQSPRVTYYSPNWDGDHEYIRLSNSIFKGFKTIIHQAKDLGSCFILANHFDYADDESAMFIALDDSDIAYGVAANNAGRIAIEDISGVKAFNNIVIPTEE